MQSDGRFLFRVYFVSLHKIILATLDEIKLKYLLSIVNWVIIARYAEMYEEILCFVFSYNLSDELAIYYKCKMRILWCK